MNSLYTLGVRQTNSLQADLERLRAGDTSASLLGQISASLSAMHRTVDDYDSMTKREIIKAKQEKAQMRVQKFKTDYAELKNEFETIKREKETEQRAELLSNSSMPISPSVTRRHQTASNSSAPNTFESDSPYASTSRQDHALREHSFIQQTNTDLDDFLDRGRAIVDNLVDQRQILRGTQKTLRSSAQTLGLSRDVIGWIDRRTTQDMWIFFGGALATFICFGLIWYYLG